MDIQWLIFAAVWGLAFAAKIVGCALVLALGWFVRHEWPAFHEAVAEGVRDRPGLSLCAGVLAQLALAIVTVVLLLTIVAIPLAIVLVTVAVLVAGLGLSTVAERVGERLPLASLRGHPERQLVMGVVVLLVISSVPLLGDALLLTAITVGSGAIAMAILSGFGRHDTHPESVITY